MSHDFHSASSSSASPAEGPENLPEELVARLQRVRSVGVITGAGISAESGIRPYRGQGGVYDDPETGNDLVDALSSHTIQHNPDRTWRALAATARGVQNAVPNVGHKALVDIENKVARFVLLTQNVDGLHQTAGSRAVIDIHGHAGKTVCMACGDRWIISFAELAAIDTAPRCTACNEGILRPDVVLFGEMLDPEKLNRIGAEFTLSVPDLMVAVGTSAMFPYIAAPVIFARRAGALTVEINPERSSLSDEVDFHLVGPAGHFLPLIAAALPLTPPPPPPLPSAEE